MKKKFFSPPDSWALHTLITFLTGVGCTYPLSLSLGLSVSPSLIVIPCALLTLSMMLLSCLSRLHMLRYPLLFAAIAALVVHFIPQADAFGAALTLLINGQAVALTAFSRPIVLLLCMLFTGFGMFVSEDIQAFIPLLVLSVLLLCLPAITGQQVGAHAMLPLLLALLLSLRPLQTSSPRILFCSLLVILGLALLLPYADSTLPSLSQTAQRVRQALDDYLFFTEARTAFSLSTTGYQPLGATKLGGPANPTDDPVMQVRTTKRTLLRGAIKNEYNGQAWVDSTSGRRYLYINPRFTGLRRNLFDQDRPSDTLREALPDAQTITVLMRADTASTLYITQRFSSLVGEGIVPYFSPSSELFTTRSLTIGDTYSFTGILLDADTAGVREVVLSASQNTDPYLNTIQAAYLQLPDTLDAQVYMLAQQVTQGSQNDFDRAQALCNYLRQTYPYTLDQRVPPAGSDFVSWFLFTERQGYCTSFASALTIMARSVGLCARYIEGYAAEPDEDGVARVTKRQGHAWVEIYFPGFGFLTFDPVPSTQDAGSSDAQQPQSNQTPSPSPSPAPSSTPSPTPTPTPEPPPTPTPAHQDPMITPTPQITPLPTPAPQADDGQAPNEPISPLLLILLALLLLVLAAAIRLMLCAPAYQSRRQKNTADALLIWYRAIEQTLLCMGIAMQPGEAPASYLLRAQTALNTRVKLTRLGQALCVARYSSRRLNVKQVERAAQTYDALIHLMKPMQRLRLILLRMRRGLHLG